MYNKISKFDVILFTSILLIMVVIYILVTVVFNDDSIHREFEDVDQYNTYFMVVDKINNFLEQIPENNNDIIYNLLDKQYLEKNNLTVSNISNHITNYGTDVSIKTDEVTYTNVDKNVIYYAHGKLQQQKYLEPTTIIEEDFSILMFWDTNNMTYSFYLLNNENYNDAANNIEKINIETNNYNKYEGTGLMTTDMICSIYLTDFIEKITIDVEGSYEIINANEKSEKFNSLEQYKSYINNNIDKFSPVADKCAVTGFDTKVYAIYDQNQNYYEFTEDKIMKYYVKFELNE